MQVTKSCPTCKRQWPVSAVKCTCGYSFAPPVAQVQAVQRSCPRCASPYVQNVGRREDWLWLVVLLAAAGMSIPVVAPGWAFIPGVLLRPTTEALSCQQCGLGFSVTTPGRITERVARFAVPALAVVGVIYAVLCVWLKFFSPFKKSI